METTITTETPRLDRLAAVMVLTFTVIGAFWTGGAVVSYGGALLACIWGACV
jgi:hypothetical protein